MPKGPKPLLNTTRAKAPIKLHKDRSPFMNYQMPAGKVCSMFLQFLPSDSRWQQRVGPRGPALARGGPPSFVINFWLPVQVLVSEVHRRIEEAEERFLSSKMGNFGDCYPKWDREGHTLNSGQKWHKLCKNCYFSSCDKSATQKKEYLRFL